MSQTDDLPLHQKLYWYVTRYAHLWLCVVGALALLGWTGSWHWAPELFSHFLPQYATLATLLLPLVFLGRAGRWRWAALAIPFLAWGALLPFWWPAGAADPPPQSRLTLLQFNAAQKTEPLTHWLIAHHTEVDVALVLEAAPSFAAAIAALETEYPHHVERLLDGPFGIALLSRHPLVEARVLEALGPEFPIIEAYVVLPSGPLRLIGIHPPPPIDDTTAALHRKFMEKLAKYLQPGIPTVVFGDLNATPWSPQARAFSRATGLHDAGGGRGVIATWPAVTARYLDLLGVPIDRTLRSSDVFIEERRTGPFLDSDHLPVVTRIAYIEPCGLSSGMRQLKYFFKYKEYQNDCDLVEWTRHRNSAHCALYHPPSWGNMGQYWHGNRVRYFCCPGFFHAGLARRRRTILPLVDSNQILALSLFVFCAWRSGVVVIEGGGDSVIARGVSDAAIHSPFHPQDLHFCGGIRTIRALAFMQQQGRAARNCRSRDTSCEKVSWACV
ncbi:MAG: endonuclease/exonuclease/phosphatase family protein [Zoogloeaceae bacterium]|jgi:endonuclease/exonuclease/phosphatase (EEP) superfamily protein YafD|nr:endonuclease/exonuclease/phosphatase family protein [Zoogloeaceae bacterium]